MSITKQLWEDNYEIALLSLNTKFVQGLKNGSLPKNIFQEYLAQDYFFLETFAKAYGLAVSKSKDKYSIRKLSELLMGCLLYTSPSPRDQEASRMPSSA